MKQDQTFFEGTYSNLTLFSLVVKYQNISITFIIDTFQFNLIAKQSSKVKQNHTGHVKFDNIFFYLQSSALLK